MVPFPLPEAPVPGFEALDPAAQFEISSFVSGLLAAEAGDLDAVPPIRELVAVSDAVASLLEGDELVCLSTGDVPLAARFDAVVRRAS